MREWRLKIDNSVLFANGTAPPSGSISLEVLEPNWWAVFVCSYIFFCWHLQTKWTKWSNFRHSLYFLSIKVLFSAIPNRPSTRALESFRSLFPSSSFKFFCFFFRFLSVTFLIGQLLSAYAPSKPFAAFIRFTCWKLQKSETCQNIQLVRLMTNPGLTQTSIMRNMEKKTNDTILLTFQLCSNSWSFR